LLDLNFVKEGIDLYFKIGIADDCIKLLWTDVVVNGMNINFHHSNHDFLIKVYGGQIIGQLKNVIKLFLTKLIKDSVENLDFVCKSIQRLSRQDGGKEPIDEFLEYFGVYDGDGYYDPESIEEKQHSDSPFVRESLPDDFGQPWSSTSFHL
jgi:hypothetical protein